MTESVLSQLISKLDPSSILLIVVLFGVWRLAKDFILSFKTNSEMLSKNIERIADDMEGLRKDVATVVSQVATHEVRIDHLERK